MRSIAGVFDRKSLDDVRDSSGPGLKMGRAIERRIGEAVIDDVTFGIGALADDNFSSDSFSANFGAEDLVVGAVFEDAHGVVFHPGAGGVEGDGEVFGCASGDREGQTGAAD